MAEIWGKEDITIEAVEEPRIDRSLDGERIRRLGIEIPPIREMLLGLVEWHKGIPGVTGVTGVTGIGDGAQSS